MIIPEIPVTGTIVGTVHSECPDTYEHLGGDIVMVERLYERRNPHMATPKRLGRLWEGGPFYINLGFQIMFLGSKYLRVSWRTPFYLLWMLGRWAETVALIACVAVGVVEHHPSTILDWRLRRSWPILLSYETTDEHGYVTATRWNALWMGTPREHTGHIHCGSIAVTAAARAYWAHFSDCIGRIPRVPVLR